MLSEEEMISIKAYEIINRLVAENEQLRNERASLNSIVCGLEDESRDRLGDKIRLTNQVTALQSRLDAIEKVWEPIREAMSKGECDFAINSCNFSTEDLDALMKGEK